MEGMLGMLEPNAAEPLVQKQALFTFAFTAPWNENKLCFGGRIEFFFYYVNNTS